MNRKEQVVFVIFLLIVSQTSVAWAKTLKEKRAEAAAAAAAAAAAPAPVSASPAEPVKPPVDPRFPEKVELIQLLAEDNMGAGANFNAAWGSRDPFSAVPPSSRAASGPALPQEAKDAKFNLIGILWGGAKPNVIINDEVYGVGSTVSGKMVKEIKEGYVVLTDGAQETILRLHN